MKKIGLILARMLQGGIDYELTKGNKQRADTLRNALARIRTQYHLN
jgi:hypothetical protein